MRRRVVISEPVGTSLLSGAATSAGPSHAGGTQYTSIAFTQRLLDAGVDASVGSVGDGYDNALAETNIGLFKAEQIMPGGPWRDQQHVEAGTLDWVTTPNAPTRPWTT